MARPYRSRRRKRRYMEEPLEPWAYLALETGPIHPSESERLAEAWRHWVPDPVFGPTWEEMTWAVATFGPPPLERR